jgi:hypothetical protein
MSDGPCAACRRSSRARGDRGIGEGSRRRGNRRCGIPFQPELVGCSTGRVGPPQPLNGPQLRGLKGLAKKLELRRARSTAGHAHELCPEPLGLLCIEGQHHCPLLTYVGDEKNSGLPDVSRLIEIAAHAHLCPKCQPYVPELPLDLVAVVHADDRTVRPVWPPGEQLVRPVYRGGRYGRQGPEPGTRAPSATSSAASDPTNVNPSSPSYPIEGSPSTRSVGVSCGAPAPPGGDDWLTASTVRSPAGAEHQ